jgi:hypothetical protein
MTLLTWWSPEFNLENASGALTKLTVPMHSLRHTFGRYITESSSDLGHQCRISRPFVGWYRRRATHEAGRARLLGVLARSFALNIVWDELDGLGLDPAVWRPIATNTRAVPREVAPGPTLSMLEPGGWLIYGSTATPPLLSTTVQSCEDALKAGAEVALAASYDSDRWDLGLRHHALEIVERRLERP